MAGPAISGYEIVYFRGNIWSGAAAVVPTPDAGGREVGAYETGHLLQLYTGNRWVTWQSGPPGGCSAGAGPPQPPPLAGDQPPRYTLPFHRRGAYQPDSGN